ncbi:MAG: TIGR03618 family F420-dependent PPOX class oxidoreductase [Streptosporangiales bacterium]|nr:TIGR03618 family F420-dependent PPOX class oxidoreductase [Streptosporangiales bacterium]
MTTQRFDPSLSDVMAGQHLGVLATIKRDGRPQLSVLSYTFDPDTALLRVSTIESLAKVANLRRDPRASFQVTNEKAWGYVVAEGEAELSAVSESPDDATVEELVEVYRAIQGEHPDWEDYRAVMVKDRRLVLRVRVDRLYGAVA